MRYSLPTIILAFSVFLNFQSCLNTNSETKQPHTVDKEKLVQEIKHLEDTLRAKADQKIDRKLAKELIEKSNTYVEAFPKDDLSPAYLFRAGNIAIGISSFKEAVSYFETIHQKYNDYERAPDALFLEGFTYENHLNDIENAKKCYNDFLKRFPDNQLADQVRVVLENIGKSPEELVKSFQKK
jgi:tetratricopeptide (TPR) repeat protein